MQGILLPGALDCSSPNWFLLLATIYCISLVKSFFCMRFQAGSSICLPQGLSSRETGCYGRSFCTSRAGCKPCQSTLDNPFVAVRNPFGFYFNQSSHGMASISDELGDSCALLTHGLCNTRSSTGWGTGKELEQLLELLGSESRAINAPSLASSSSTAAKLY